jgi:hypothetical protein
LSEAQCRLLGLDVSAGADASPVVATDRPPPRNYVPDEARAPETTAAREAYEVEGEPEEPETLAPPVAAASRAEPKAPANAVRVPLEVDRDEDAEEPWGDELARRGRQNAASTPRARPIRVARGTVVVHLFSRSGPLMGPRFAGTLSSVKGRSFVVDLALPEGETDAVAYAAILGDAARAVCLRDGRVLWDVPTRVDLVAVAEEAPEVVRITLLAARTPPATLRRLENARKVSPAA